MKFISAFFLVVGLSLGSIASMFLNPDMWEIYTAWAGGKAFFGDVISGAVLGAVGFIASFLLTKYELKRER